MSKVILAFDLASKTGYAAGSTPHKRSRRKKPRLMKHGAIDLHLLAEETHGSQMYRFHDWLENEFGKYAKFPSSMIEAVYVERAHLRGWSASLRAVGMFTMLSYWADSLPQIVPVEMVHTSTLKKAATGDGRAAKYQMIESASDYWDVPIISDDHADALCLLKHAFDLET